jgi:BTB/POZ domain
MSNIADSGRPLKRSRVNLDLAEGKFERSSIAWWDDGNVVLQVEDTRFRVHKSILSTHSPLFRDMFSLPASAESQLETEDGCPVVTLHHDKARHWSAILEMMYDGFR